MSYQHTQNITVDTPGGATARQNAYTANQHSGYSNSALPAATETAVDDFAVDVSAAVSAFMYCDRDCQIDFNDDGSPSATVLLLAGKPLIWANDSGLTSPLGATDITGFHATLAAGAAANLIVDVIYN